jgi:two-component system, OmpR family, sensor histidine kinase CiaH
MALSLTFSGVLYHFAAHELSEGLHHQYEVLQEADHDADDTDNTSASELRVREENIIKDFTYLNGAVLITSVLAGYFLARRTIRPIEAAHRSQIRFTAEASHELKTPLTAMKADTESVLMQPKSDKRELRNTLERNLEDIGRLETLTKHLLDMGRYRSGVSLQTSDVELKQLIKSVVRQLDLKYGNKHLSIVQDVPSITLHADPTAIEQLLVIILDNAYKYSNDKGAVQIAAREERGTITITISDSGIGIPEADLPHIFEYFYRSSHAISSQKASGYGLGLPLARDIVRACRGNIEISSSENKGTSVVVTLPLKSSWKYS